jgi:CarboxypepD_reg-like domain
MSNSGIYNMVKLSFLFALVLFCQAGLSQANIRGRVISDDTKKPLPSASVYLNNTSIGTITNEQGVFIIGKIPSGKFKLIASSVGYETYAMLIDPRELSKELIISLKPKSEELQGFAVLPAEPDGWKKWGKTFTDIFIGTTPNSNDCKLMNPEVIKFRMNADNTLTAFAKEPLQVMNYSLGYEIRYKLEEFEYNLNSKLVNYSGYAFFTDMAIAHPNRARRYAEERLEIFTGSFLHFMRAFYLNKLEVEGFEMRNLGNISNPEKDRAKKLFSLQKDSLILNTTSSAFTITNNASGQPYISSNNVITVDSTDYFKKKLLEPDSVISHQLISADSIGFAVDSFIAGLYFKDSLEVSYKLKDIPNRYKALSKENKHQTFPISQFVFVYRRPVYVLSNGYYYKPYDLKITGYWAWEECMSTRLPYDYSSGKK